MHRTTKKRNLYLLLITLLGTFSAGCFYAPRIYADSVKSGTIAASYTAYNAINLNVNAIIINGKNQSENLKFTATFTDAGPWDDTYQYTYTNGSCNSKIDLSSSGASSGKLSLSYPDLYNKSSCINIQKKVSIGNLSAGVFANWTSATTLTTSVGNYSLAQDGNSDVYEAFNTDNILDIHNSCLPSEDCHINQTNIRLTVSSDNKTADAHIFSNEAESGVPDRSVTNDFDNVRLGGSPSNPVTPPSQPKQSAGNGNSGGDSSSSIDCTFDVNPLTWIVCPVVDGINLAASKLDEYVNIELQFDASAYGGTTGNGTQFFDNTQGSGGSNAYYKAWSAFRIIATALLIIGGLVMIASQAFGFEFLDAYTIRKVLPRLLIAVIGISLSWPIMKFMVGFFDYLGQDIGDIMFAPFGGTGANGAGGFALFANSTATGTSAALTGSGLLLAGLGLGIVGALSFGLTAILALLVGFLIIVARNAALIAILIVAPIGIAAYILPNTQKIWKLWSDNFLGLLLVYPIITIMIAVGKIFAWSALSGAAQADTANKAVLQIMGFSAYILPFFALPLAFRLATGFIGNIAGFMNDRGRGAFDRLKKYRGNKLAQNTAAMKAGTRTNNRAFNALTSRATTKRMGFGQQGQAAYNQKMDVAAAEFAKSPQGMAVQHNDAALRAMTYGSAIAAKQNMGRDFNMSEDEVNSAVAAAKANGGFGRARQVYAAQQLSATGTGYDDLQQVAQTIARVSNGNANQASSLAGNINSSTKQANRYDLAPGYGNLNRLAQNEMGGGNSQDAYHEASVQAARGVDAVSLLRGKPHQVESLATSLGNHAQRQYLRSQQAATPQEREAATHEFLQTMGQIDQLNQSKSYASTTNQGHVNDLLNSTQHLRTQGLDTVLGRTYDGSGQRSDIVMGPAGNAVVGPTVTQQQINNREVYDQARAPVRNPNDPNTI